MRVVETWPEYVRRVTAGHTQAQIAAKTGGIAASNVGRWLRGDPGMPRADSVVALAKAFNRPPAEALIAAGYLTADDIPDGAAIPRRTPLSAYTEAELLDELRRRVT